MLVKSVVTEFAIEAFYESVLGWFSWLNEVQFNAGFPALQEHHLVFAHTSTYF